LGDRCNRQRPETVASSWSISAPEKLTIEIIGETKLLPWKRPRLWRNGSFFNAAEALTDYRPGGSRFIATVIFSAENWPVFFIHLENYLKLKNTGGIRGGWLRCFLDLPADLRYALQLRNP